MAVPDIVARLRLNAADFSRTSKMAFAGFGREAEIAGADAAQRAGSKFAIGLKTFLGGAAVSAIAATIDRALDYAGSLGEVAGQLGITTDELQKYRFAAQQSGASSEEFDKAIQKLTRNVGSAVEGNKTLRSTFADLGVGIVDANGNARATGEIFRDIAQKLGDIEDPAARARTEVALFGRAGQQLDVLLAGGIDQLDNLSAAAERLGIVLSAKEIQQADDAADKLAAVKTVLEADIARVVAQNAEAILSIANAIGEAANRVGQFFANMKGVQRLQKDEGWARGFFATPGLQARASTAQGYVKYRSEQAGAAGNDLRIATQRLAENPNDLALQRGVGRLAKRVKDEVALLRAANNEMKSETSRTARAVTVPDLEGVVLPSPPRSGGRSSVRSRSAIGDSSAREATRVAKQQSDEYARQVETLAELTARQGQSAALDGKRLDSQLLFARGQVVEARQLEVQADVESALARLRESFPQTLRGTFEEYQKATGKSREQYEIDRAGLTVLERREEAIVRENAAKEDGVTLAREQSRADKDRDEAAQRALREQQEAVERRAEQQFDDLAAFYEDLFSGRTDDIWRNFKRQGIATLAAIAARWTLGKLGVEGSAIAVNPFAGIGQGGTSSLAAFGLNGGGSIIDAIFGKGNKKADAATAAGGVDDLSKLINGGIGGGAGAAGAAGAAAKSVSSISSLMGTASLVIGGISLLTSLAGGLFKKTERGGAAITSVESAPTLSGNKGDYQQLAGTMAGAVQDGLKQIADALGAEIGGFSVAIGKFGDEYRINRDGTKAIGGVKGSGAESFASEEAAVRAAIADALSDGAIHGISDASERILRSGQALETAIEKAVLIEQVPKLLRQRLDPTGTAIDEVNERFAKLVAALEEGGATAEQMADAQKLYNFELADAKANTATAAAGLREFRDSLTVGSASPLSLREQEAAARMAVEPFLQQIEAGQAVDQDKYRNAAQTFLDVERSLNGSTSAFFVEFERIQAATTKAISAIDNAVPIAPAVLDPFTKATADAAAKTALNTQTGNEMTEDTNTLLSQNNLLLARLLAAVENGDGSGYIGDLRGFGQAA